MSNDCSAGCDRPAMYCARCLALANGGKLAEVGRDRDEWRTTCTGLVEKQTELVGVLEEIEAFGKQNPGLGWTCSKKATQILQQLKETN